MVFLFDRRQKLERGLFLDVDKKAEKNLPFKTLFPQAQRITVAEFTSVLKGGKTTQSPSFSLCFAPDSKLFVSVVASKKVSKKAVIRNKNKRRVRSLLKELTKQGVFGYFIVFIKKDLSKTKASNLKEELSRLVSRAVL